MHLRRLEISNFKGIRSLEIEFPMSSSGTPALVALLGDNGSGKTSVMQAIALVLSLATRRIPSADQLQWNGFMAERISSLGPTRVRLDVRLDSEEIEAAIQLRKALIESNPDNASFQDRGIDSPTTHEFVSLVFESGRLSSPQGSGALAQFHGRAYFKELMKPGPLPRDRVKLLGDVYWFDQNRNLSSTMFSRTENGSRASERGEAWAGGVEQLREFLIGWWAFHRSSEKRGSKDYIPELQQKFTQVFPGTLFAGIAPMPDAERARASDFYFLLERDGHVFDIAEMSSGEQAVFPLVYEFVRLDIARSIVLIDELEMHLHPPQQQALLTALPSIGPDCQFIISTHSPYLEGAIPDEYEVRLEGGSLCL